MRKLQLLFLLGSLSFATGCPKYKPKVDFNNPNGFVNQLNAYLKDAQRQYACTRFGPDHIDLKNVRCTGYTKDEKAAEQIRNEVVENALAVIDGAYEDFVTDLQSGRDRTNFVADLIELGTTGTVGIVNGQRPLQILGVALTAFRGGRRSADLNFYKEQATPVLISKMDGNRATIRAAILDGEQKDVNSYPLGMAISDIVDYYNAGTLVRAFTELQKDTAAQAKISEKALADAKAALGVVGAPTAAQIEESKQNFAVVRKIIKAFTDARDAEAAAQKIISLERAKTPPNQPDQNEITKQQAIVTAQKKTQQDVLDDLQSLFDIIQADPKLKPFIEQIPVAGSDGDPQEQQLLRASLNKIKGKDPNNRPDIMDFNSIFLTLNGLVSDAAEKDPSIRGRLKAKLSTSKTISATP